MIIYNVQKKLYLNDIKLNQMKKLLLTFCFITFISLTATSQEIGLRFGNFVGGNAAIDITLSKTESTRLHSILSVGDGIGLSVIYNFIYKPIGDSGFLWYAGVGPYVLTEDPFSLGAVGEIGIEYQIDKGPFTVGVDWLPYFRLIDDTSFGTNTLGVNVRYRF